jgi:hypothetical protein
VEEEERKEKKEMDRKEEREGGEEEGEEETKSCRKVCNCYWGLAVCKWQWTEAIYLAN